MKDAKVNIDMAAVIESLKATAQRKKDDVEEDGAAEDDEHEDAAERGVDDEEGHTPVSPPVALANGAASREAEQAQAKAVQLDALASEFPTLDRSLVSGVLEDQGVRHFCSAAETLPRSDFSSPLLIGFEERAQRFGRHFEATEPHSCCGNKG